MKKVIAVVLALLICVSLTACGSDDNYEKYEKYDAIIDCLERGDYDGAVTEIEKFKNGVYDSLDENGDPKTVSVEITAENWQNYFDLVQRDAISKNQFDEISDVYKQWYLVIKDGYTIVPNETSIAVEYNYVEQWHYVTKDLTAGTVTLGDTVPDKTPRDSKGNMTTIRSKETAIINSRNYTDTAQGVPINVEIVRMQGTLCIYGE